MMFFFILLFCVIYGYIAVGQDYGGPFDMTLGKWTDCKEVPMKKCDTVKTNFTVINRTAFHSEFKVTENLKNTKLKVITIVKGKQRRIQFNSLCQNTAIKMIFGQILNLSSDCKVLQGTNKVVIDLYNIEKVLFGGQFLYGNYTYKVTMYNNHCIYFCGHFETNYYPKGSQ